MTCSSGCTGPSNSGAQVVTDGDNSYASGVDTRCVDNELCTFVTVTTTTSTNAYALKAIYDGGATVAYLGHDGLALGMFDNVTSGSKWSISRAADTNNSWTMQSLVPLDSGESFLSSNGSSLQMVSTADTANERWSIAGLS